MTNEENIVTNDNLSLDDEIDRVKQEGLSENATKAFNELASAITENRFSQPHIGCHTTNGISAGWFEKGLAVGIDEDGSWTVTIVSKTDSKSTHWKPPDSKNAIDYIVEYLKK